MKLIPVNNYIVVKALEPKKATESGIIIPEGVEEDGDMQTSFAEVVATEEGSKYKVGMMITFSKLVPNDMLIEDSNGEKHNYWTLKETDIELIVEQ